MKRFIAEAGETIHALELNGLRHIRENREAAQLAREGHQRLVLGDALYYAGLGGVLAGVVGVTVGAAQVTDSRAQWGFGTAGAILAAAGLISLVGGIFAINDGLAKVLDAVNVYNLDLVRGVPATDRLAGALDLLSMILTFGDGSLLVRELVHKKQLCTEVSSDHGWRIDSGVFMLAAELAADSSIKRVERVILEQLAELAANPVKPALLERAKAQLRVVLLRERQTALGRCHVLGNCEHLLGGLGEAEKQYERLRAVTPKTIREAAEAVFKVGQSTMVWVDP